MRAPRESWAPILAVRDIAEAAAAIVTLAERVQYEEEGNAIAPMVAVRAMARIIAARADQVAIALGGEAFGYFNDGIAASGAAYPPAAEGTDHR